jgi:hypothetical protein
MAGTGKSTIARTIARKYHGLKRLGASFFFSRRGGDLGHAGKFFTTIAMQLANNSPALKDYICKAIDENKDIASQAFRDQWNQLVLRPLSMLTADSRLPPLILVIDALDECEGEEDVHTILQLLAETRGLGEIRLRILVTSRPETAIRLGFENIPSGEHENFILHNISESIIEHDLTVYFKHELTKIRRERGYPSDWPGDQTSQLLIQKAGGLFIWAATACLFIRDGKRVAKNRLSLILEGVTNGMPTEKKLDEIYLTILTDSISGDYNEGEEEKLCEIFKQIVGSIVTTFEALSAGALARLLEISKEEVNQTLHDLHSVLKIPKNSEESIHLLHPSFRDFLLNRERCWDHRFQIDEQKTHEVTFDRCLQLMRKSLRRDICGLHAPGTLVKDVRRDKVEQCLPTELQYACVYWVQHLQRSKARLCDDSRLHVFLQEHLLHWLEALSLLGKTSEGVLAIAFLESVTTVSDKLNIFNKSLLTYEY